MVFNFLQVKLKWRADFYLFMLLLITNLKKDKKIKAVCS